MHQGQWEVEPCNIQPHRLRAAGSETPIMHCLTPWGQWAGQLLQCPASAPEDSGQWNTCNALPHCMGLAGRGTPAMHCHTTWAQRAVDLLQCIASLPGGTGQWNSCNALPHCLGVVVSGTPEMHCVTAYGPWAVQLLHCTAPMRRGVGQWNSWNAMPHCLVAMGSVAAEYTTSLPGGTRQCNSCNARGVHCRSSTAHCPYTMRQCIVGLALPTALQDYGSLGSDHLVGRTPSPSSWWPRALLTFVCPRPAGGVAVYCKISTANCPEAVRQHTAGVALPTAPMRCGRTLQEFECTLPPDGVAVHCSNSGSCALQAAAA